MEKLPLDILAQIAWDARISIGEFSATCRRFNHAVKLIPRPKRLLYRILREVPYTTYYTYKVYYSSDRTETIKVMHTADTVIIKSFSILSRRTTNGTRDIINISKYMYHKKEKYVRYAGMTSAFNAVYGWYIYRRKSCIEFVNNAGYTTGSDLRINSLRRYISKSFANVLYIDEKQVWGDLDCIDN